MEIEGLPSGNFFTFATNFFISVSFQFVGEYVRRERTIFPDGHFYSTPPPQVSS
jgi:Protein of unknown function (DUF2370)